MAKKIGFTDEPAIKDEFDIKQYVQGLGAFIKECEMPMTIAVQGDWGSGKTSIMNLVNAELRDSVISVWFNTWKFSQFDMEDNLAIIFLTYLTTELEKYGGDSFFKEFIGFLKTSGKKGIQFIGDVTEQVIGSSVVKSTINDFLNISAIEAIDKLKESFQKSVDEIYKKNGNKRIVFFIDDLDRLQPVRAVELLEVLKIFLDCNNCVFVLAIDYEVVSQGIKEKYNNSLDERKSRKFFEKIIQVPFKMPVAHYNIDGYIQNRLKDLDIKNDRYIKDYISLIRTSIGCNPRAMKRTFNAYKLLSKVYVSNNEIEEVKVLIFGSLCMQLTYEDVYNYIVGHLYDNEDGYEDLLIDEEFFNAVIEDRVGSLEKNTEFIALLNNSKEYNGKEVFEFLKSFANAIKQESEQVKTEHIERLKEVFQKTSVTSTGNGIVGRGARKDKKYDAVFKKVTINSLINKEVKSFNSCKVEWYSINGRVVDCTDRKVAFSEILTDVLEYAYANATDMFNQKRNEAIESEKSVYQNLFCPERTSNPSYYNEITENKYKISLHSSNDAKIRQIYSLYNDIGLDTNCIELSIKEAHNA